ncbi:HtaA domain-containing protein [Microbacterium indicum]|uniref:HtaA domain-containing protein n=1 Tax=Microbacterium indicum TaxID=358100 RepID=UPI00041CBD43|nr:HtaA domain-containing protein [Microbacterium indicum]
MNTTRTHRTAKKAALAVVATAALALGGVAAAAPASAAEGDVVASSGSLEWGFKQSFRNYVSMFSGDLVASEGATKTDTGFSFPTASGHVTGSDDLTVQTSGRAQFAIESHFFDVQLSDIAVVVEGGTAQIVADVHLWAGTSFGSVSPGTYDNADVPIADVADAAVTVDGDSVTVSGTGVTLTEEGVSAAPLYEAGAALDDFTLTATLEGAATPEPEPEPAGDDEISVTVPETDDTTPEPETGSFGWAWGSVPTTLGTATDQGDGSFVATGTLNPVTVTDTRAGGTGSYGWSLGATVSDFTSSAGSFDASHLAWTPKVTATDAALESIVVGTASTDLSGTASDNVLATANAAVSAELGADLTLSVPTSTPAGDYRATVTISSIG